MLEQQALEERTGLVLVLLEHHVLVEVEVGCDICAELDPDGGSVGPLSAEGALLLDRCDLHGEHLQREHTSNQELAKVWLDLGWEAAPFVQQQPYAPGGQGRRQLPEGAGNIAEV